MKYIITTIAFFIVMVMMYKVYISNYLIPSSHPLKGIEKIKLLKKTGSNQGTVIYMKHIPESFLVPTKLKREVDQERFDKAGKVLQNLIIFYNNLGDEFIKF